MRGANPFGRYIPISVTNPSVWWMLDQQRIYLTADGGRRWRSLRPRNIVITPASTISGADARHAWLAAAEKLFATSNGGRSWRLINSR